ncbi:MAG TPA: pentapeptide repeat-containing protein [Solirubrobacteraceae bacterium]|nr:pentapeptide repeat-containing protein [Solirubrobacteraceae bacterium]
MARVPRPAAVPSPPRLPKQLDRTPAGDLHGQDRCVEVELTDVGFSDHRTDGLRLDTIKLTRVDLSGSHLQRVRVIDADLTDCNLANLDARGADASRVAIARSRLTGIELRDGSLADLTITGCRVDLASFGSCRLARVTFDECLMTESTFIDAELDAVRFHDCDLTRADFRGARLRRCEFRRTDLSQLEGVADLRGAAIDWPTIVGLAGVWAGALGIAVLDDDQTSP